MSTVPEEIKKNVRAVLLSKVGGILVSDFTRDYKTLLREQLNYKQLNFNTLNDFIKAMPDVVRLEFSETDMAYKMFGIVDPDSSYTPWVAKMAAGSSPDCKIDKRRSNKCSFQANGDCDDNLRPNQRGHYTLCYQKYKESSDATKESLEEKFEEFQGFHEVHMIPKMIFVRFTSKEGALACLEKYSQELGIKIAEEKNPAKGPSKINKQEEDLIIPKKKVNENHSKDGRYEVYIGNLASNVTTEDVEALCSEFGPTSVRACKKKDDPKKVFAFVDFSDAASAQTCVDKLDKMDHKGRTINVRMANRDGPPQQPNPAPSTPSGGKVSWRSGGGQAASASGIAALENEDESWDMENKSNNATGVNKISWRSGGNNEQPAVGNSSFGKSSSSVGQNSSFGQSTSFGQSSSSFGQNSSSFEQNSSSFGQKTFPGNSSVSRQDPKTGSEDSEVTLYFGNLYSNITQEELQNLVQEFSPVEVRVKRDKNDSRKVFAFVVVSSESVAMECVKKFDQMDYKGRNVNCRISQNSQPSKQTDSQSSQTGKSLSWKSNREKQTLNNNDESWDIKTKNSTMHSPNSNDISAGFSGLTIQTGESFHNQSAKSPTYQQKSGQAQQKTPPRISQSNQLNCKQNSPQKRSPKSQPSPDFSDMPPLEPSQHVPDFSEMPPLEPAIVDEMPPLEPINGETIRVWVANFPYYQTEDDLMEWFQPLGGVDITMINKTNTMKTTGAVIHFLDMETAEYAIEQSHQANYKGRLLWVQMYENDPEKRQNVSAVNLSISLKAGCDGERSVSVASYSVAESPNGTVGAARSCESLSSTHSTSTSFRNYCSLLKTYKLIMNRLGTRVRDVKLEPYSTILVYITSVYDENSFWGQVVEDDTTISQLEDTLELLQMKESKIGFTKGLGRCAANIDGEWFRAWIIADRKDFTIEVFNLDYGTTAVINRKDAALTIPEIWDLQPAVRPFKIADGFQLVTKDMEQTLVNVQITGTNVDDTGFLTEVRVMGVPE